MKSKKNMYWIFFFKKKKIKIRLLLIFRRKEHSFLGDYKLPFTWETPMWYVITLHLVIKDNYFSLLFGKQSVKQIYKDKYHLVSTLASTKSYHFNWLFCRIVNCRGKYIFPQPMHFSSEFKIVSLLSHSQISLQHPG